MRDAVRWQTVDGTPAVEALTGLSGKREHWVRLDVYLATHTLDQAIEKAVDALSGIAVEVYVREGGIADDDPNKWEVSAHG
jgi:hypothetical protein